jgi:hypothetical protein
LPVACDASLHQRWPVAWLSIRALERRAVGRADPLDPMYPVQDIGCLRA